MTDPLRYAAPDATHGSGPFKLVSYSEGKGEYLLAAHAAYFRGRPLVDTLAYVLVPLAQRVIGLQAHAAYAILSTDYAVVRTFGQGPTWRTPQTPPFSVMRLPFNVDRPPFDQRPFRQALAYSIGSSSANALSTGTRALAARA